jgi:hypothetical protein
VRTLILLCAVFLASCATAPSEPIMHTETVTVRVPVPVKCVDPAKVPTIPASAMPAEGDTAQLANGAAADVLALRAYAVKADALLRACSQ